MKPPYNCFPLYLLLYLMHSPGSLECAADMTVPVLAKYYAVMTACAHAEP